MKESKELINFRTNPAMVHLGLAVDLLHMANKESSHGVAHNYSVSSIVHAFIGFESVINKLGFELFSDVSSPRFMPVESRNIPVRRLIEAWNRTLPITDKFEYLMELKSVSIERNLIAQFSEITNLRNMLIHGFAYSVTILVKPTEGEDNSYEVIDQEDSVDWDKKFPNLKFNPITDLGSEDARKVLRVLLRCLQSIYVGFQEVIVFVCYQETPHIHILNADSKINEKILE